MLTLIGVILKILLLVVEFPQKHELFFTRKRHLHTVTACVVVTNFTVCHEYGLETEANRGLLRQKFSMNVVFTHILANESQSKTKNEERKTTIAGAKKRSYVYKQQFFDKIIW